MNLLNLILCGCLLLGQPLRMAMNASIEIQSLPMRGWPLAVGLVLRMIVTSVGVAAGISLYTRKPGAIPLAKSALVLSAGLDGLVYFTPMFPNNRYPGQTAYFVSASLLYHGLALAYLFRRSGVAFRDE